MTLPNECQQMPPPSLFADQVAQAHRQLERTPRHLDNYRVYTGSVFQPHFQHFAKTKRESLRVAAELQTAHPARAIFVKSLQQVPRGAPIRWQYNYSKGELVPVVFRPTLSMGFLF